MSLLLARQTPPAATTFALGVAPERLARPRAFIEAVAVALGPAAENRPPSVSAALPLAPRRAVESAFASVIVPAVAAFVLQVPTAHGPVRLALPGSIARGELVTAPVPPARVTIATSDAPSRLAARGRTESALAEVIHPAVAAFVLEAPSAEAPARLAPTPSRAGEAALALSAAAAATIATADAPSRLAARGRTESALAEVIHPAVAAFVLEAPSAEAPVRASGALPRLVGHFALGLAAQEAVTAAAAIFPYRIERMHSMGDGLAGEGVSTATQPVVTPSTAISSASPDIVGRRVNIASVSAEAAFVEAPAEETLAVATAPAFFELSRRLRSSIETPASVFAPAAVTLTVVAAPETLPRPAASLGTSAEVFAPAQVTWATGTAPEGFVRLRAVSDGAAEVFAPAQVTWASVSFPDTIARSRALEEASASVEVEVRVTLAGAVFPDALARSRPLELESAFVESARVEAFVEAEAPSEIARPRPVYGEVGWAPFVEERELVSVTEPDRFVRLAPELAEGFAWAPVAAEVVEAILASSPEIVARARTFEGPFEAFGIQPPGPPITPRIPSLITFQSPGATIGGPGGLGPSWIQMPPAECDDPETRKILRGSEDMSIELQALIDHADRAFQIEDAEARGFVRGRSVGIAAAFAARVRDKTVLEHERALARAREDALLLELENKKVPEHGVLLLVGPETWRPYAETWLDPLVPIEDPCEPVFVPAETWPVSGYEPAPEPEPERTPMPSWVWWTIAGVAVVSIVMAVLTEEPKPAPPPVREPAPRPPKPAPKKKRRRARIRRR